MNQMVQFLIRTVPAATIPEVLEMAVEKKTPAFSRRWIPTSGHAAKISNFLHRGVK